MAHPFRPAAHLRREEQRLRQAGIDSWDGLADLDDARLRDLAASGEASEARLIRLRGQARLVSAVGLAPEEAALLLHGGIASPAGPVRPPVAPRTDPPLLRCPGGGDWNGGNGRRQ